MADDALRRLEALRADAVQQAQRAVAAAERAWTERDQLVRATQVARLGCERALAQARAAFAGADSVFALRAGQLLTQRAEASLARAEARVASAVMARTQLAEARARAQSELRAAELARRVVSRTVEQRAADVSLRTERRQEDERDDQYRAALSARTRRDFPNA